MDAALVQALVRLVRRARARLVSVQPAWLRAYAAFGGARRWAVLPGSVTAGCAWAFGRAGAGCTCAAKSLSDPAASADVLERRLSLFDGALEGGQLFVQGAPAVSLPRGWRCIAGGAGA
jgi:hypothetical protein